MADIRSRDLRGRWRRALFWLFVGGLIVLGAVMMLLDPLLVLGDTSTNLGISIVVFEIVLLIAGLSWLALLVTTRPRRPPEEFGRDG
ncbi:hypothetical protein NYQ83_04690 [Afifella sp. JA880]|uniref:hypothetical protein n=1 Tax=Afifella sp. JA880 TaxID=2975280 RepID=UPI0021BB8A04|nr:hypothetical protein [Afifella sp. JA880]MCT8266562.1 hypothetical protein [Afifella sp. JA880]